jgi:UDPglucose--hexose-1-phosphate uridylyltransferase
VEFHPPLRTPDTLKYLAGPEVGGGSMTNESDPDEKAAELRAAAGPHHAAQGEAR